MTDQPSQEIDIISVLGDDKTTVAYRPALARILDSALAAVLLQQMIYWWKQSERKTFFKFKQACKHKAYKPGDSWCEELALSRSEFDNALAKIGTKIKKGMTREAVLAFKMPLKSDFKGYEKDYDAALKIAFQHAILYWTDGNRLTWYMINEPILKSILALAYGPKAESSFTYVKQNPALSYKAESSFTYITENTQRSHREEENTLPVAIAPAQPIGIIDPQTAEVTQVPTAQMPLVTAKGKVLVSESVLTTPSKVPPKVSLEASVSGGKYVPPSGYEQVWMIHTATGNKFEHLVESDNQSPQPTCKRCKLKLDSGVRVSGPITQIFERCLGKEPKPRKARDAPVTYTAEVKNSLAELCKQDWTIPANASAMGRTLKQLDGKINVPMLARFKANWYRCDFRGQRGQAPKPNQVVDCWTELTESDGCKDANGTLRQPTGQDKGVEKPDAGPKSAVAARAPDLALAQSRRAAETRSLSDLLRPAVGDTRRAR